MHFIRHGQGFHNVAGHACHENYKRAGCCCFYFFSLLPAASAAAALGCRLSLLPAVAEQAPRPVHSCSAEVLLAAAGSKKARTSGLQTGAAASWRWHQASPAEQFWAWQRCDQAQPACEPQALPVTTDRGGTRANNFGRHRSDLAC